ncbi:MAG TPA: RNA polymerase sigma factor [Longimicrobiales bacterium]
MQRELTTSPEAQRLVVPDSAAADLTVRRAQAGDETAFGRLYDEHAGPIYALCLRMSGDAVEAATLTQDVFVRAWTGLAGFRGESAFGTWLHRLAVNVVLTARRGAGRRELRVEGHEDPDTLPGAATPPPQVESAIDLERAIASLPEGARTVLVLYDVEGYTHDEIAALCGIAPGTSKAQLHRARRLLRERLDR